MEQLNPDEGFGKPGSLRWHTLHVSQCESWYELLRYVNSVTGKPLGFLEQAKKFAVLQIGDFLNGKGK